MDDLSYLSNSSVEFVEDQYKQYLQDPESVEFGWRKFFEGFEFSRNNYDTEAVPDSFHKEFKVINLINGYRQRGHLFTLTNPVRERRKYSPTLDIENFGLEQSDLNEVFSAGTEIGIGKATLQQIIDHLQETYCRSVGVEYAYIRQPAKVTWLREKLEPTKNSTFFSADDKKAILSRLSKAVMFEQFLHKKFVGQKRFSLEGGESLIPALNHIIEKGADLGIKEFVIGMAHRGRLNVLSNILQKTQSDIFSEFEGKEYEDSLFDGDVKYHLGYSSDVKTPNGKTVHLSLSPNPSHLEAVDPVVEGIVRSKIDRYLHDDGVIAPILIHGDASIAGQGIVYEVVQMAKLKGYKTGGTIHIVVNNQIGFTTNYIDARSSTYCTDVGKVTLSPVFHVNGDDVEAVTHAVQVALEYRQKFKSDVFIDLLCYRKYGHNEGDEPRFTQPLLYNIIAKHPNPRDIYLQQLLKEGVITKEEENQLTEEFRNVLDNRLEEAKQIEKASAMKYMTRTWEDVGIATAKDFEKSPNTGYNKKRLLELGKIVTSLPQDKKFFKKIVKLIDERAKMAQGASTLDWAMGETMAYATLLDEGYRVRISGQDVERGTFSHRHAVLRVEDSEEEYIPLKSIEKNKGDFSIYNSFLSEYGVLGFDYGYAMAAPDTLTIWEAQFGDFGNGAQIIIDQFISSAEEKWKTKNGLVMLLPHGYEGQGAEHSSARLERYLELCADNNIQVANATTPANFYHLLRRQLHRNFRKPLIVMTPKSLLRHPEAVSSLDELTKGGFQEIIGDKDVKAADVKRVLVCSGKIYYDLTRKRNEKKIKDVAIIRMEQLYPSPEKQLSAELKKYTKSTELIWVQEEPENMGPWTFIDRILNEFSFDVICRRASGSPATGSHQAHNVRQEAILEEAVDINFKAKTK